MTEIRFTRIPTARDRGHRTEIAMTATEFAAALQEPVLVADKEQRPAASWGIHSPGRIVQDTLQSATAVLLDFDSKGTVSPAFDVAAQDCAQLDFAAYVHTSYSHTAERPAYRLIVPLTGTLEPRLTPPATRLLMHLLSRIGGYNDPASIGIGRLFFLPCVHPERQAYYQAWSTPEKPLLDAAELAGMAQKLLDCEQKQEQRLAERKPLTARNSGYAGQSLIADFNAATTFEQLFNAAGYRQVKPGRWLSPASSSGMAGITLNRETGRVYCGHESDPLFVSERHSHDPFSVYCVLWHNGDTRKAIAAIRQRSAA